LFDQLQGAGVFFKIDLKSGDGDPSMSLDLKNQIKLVNFILAFKG